MVVDYLITKRFEWRRS